MKTSILRLFLAINQPLHTHNLISHWLMAPDPHYLMIQIRRIAVKIDLMPPQFQHGVPNDTLFMLEYIYCYSQSNVRSLFEMMLLHAS